MKFHNNRLLDSETYVGARVEALASGVYRQDLALRFEIDHACIEMLIN